MPLAERESNRTRTQDSYTTSGDTIASHRGDGSAIG